MSAGLSSGHVLHSSSQATPQGHGKHCSAAALAPSDGGETEAQWGATVVMYLISHCWEENQATAGSTDDGLVSHFGWQESG
jgi:hypothetical protein